MTQISTHTSNNVPEADLLALLPHLRAFALSLVRNRDRADDLVQEAVVRALAASARFQPGTNLKAWMFTILRNAFYTEFRKGSLVQSLDSSPIAEPRVSGNQEACLEYGDFRRAFWQLGSDKREVLMLVGASGLTCDEAARICGCAIGTIKSRVSRARGDLRRILDNDLLDGKRRDTPALAA